MAERVWEGAAGTPGVALGRVWRVDREAGPEGPDPPAGSSVPPLDAWEAARDRVDQALARLALHARENALQETADILEAQRMMLSDPALAEQVAAAVGKGRDAITATQEAVDALAGMLAAVNVERLRERAEDVREVGRALQAALRGRDPYPLASVPRDAVVCARTLAAGELAAIPRERLAGLVLEQGGATSHVAIMARTMGLPAVLGVEGFLDTVVDGEEIVVDGSAARVLVKPSEEERTRYRRALEQEARQAQALAALRNLPAETQDGHRVTLYANIGGPQDVRHALEAGAEGVGLFRTEFLVIDRPIWPSEEEQLRSYRQVLETMGNRPVIFRTFDVGGDKPVPLQDPPVEANPFLGSRAIRLGLARPELLRGQLRSILRAAVETGVQPWIMLPMVTTLEEVREARRHLDEIRREVKDRWDRDVEPRLGAMVETPAAALNARALAREVDFFSIGSNDLVQYTMAVDRINEHVAGLYQATHPAVLRLIKETVEAAREAGIPCDVCGEMAGDERLVPLLIGLGVTELSMSPSSLARVKDRIRTLTLADARALAARALQCSTAREVDRLLQG